MLSVEAIDGFLDFEVDETFVYMLSEVILFDCEFRENVDWHFNVFKMVIDIPR